MAQHAGAENRRAWNFSQLTKGTSLYATAASIAIVFDILLICAIIATVPYTKIDWDAYMSQVTQYLHGERNYENIFGDTGPLVYPAGFLYVYSGIKFLTNATIFPAQILFGALYIVNLAILLLIYMKAAVVPWWVLLLLTLSRRVHSLFVLRLFNDCVAVTLAHSSIALMQSQHWNLGLVVFSAAVSVKMNVLLYAPPLLLLLLKSLSLKGVVTALFYAALLQILVGLPFLLFNPLAYLSRAFNLGRVFIHFWSVNLKFLPEPVFVSKQLAIALLILHLGLLFLFARLKWCKHEDGILRACGFSFGEGPKQKVGPWSAFVDTVRQRWSCGGRTLTAEHISTVLFTGNFIGIICARSLHYQFYTWYFFSLPLLLWKTHYSTPVRLVLLLVVELCWNVYPSNAVASLVLLIAHLTILWGIWQTPSEYPYVVGRKENCSEQELRDTNKTM